MNAKIENLNQDDLVECAELYADAFKEPPWEETWSTEDAFERLNNFLACPNTIALKRVENNRILGFLIGETQQWNDSRLFYLKEICVNGKNQRKGVGKSLIRNLTQQPPAKAGGLKLRTESPDTGR
ncbi:GNAT family N-acetyltransferase, partial [Thiorhodococcus fuscus]